METEKVNKTEFIIEDGKQELFIIREFDANRDLVYKALSDIDLLPQWMGCSSMRMEIDKLENKNHGSWRFIHIDGEGNKYAFNGVIHEVMVTEIIIRTFEFEGLPERGHVSLEFLTLEELPMNRTKITIHVIYKSVQDRNGHVQSGMEHGVIDSHNRLDEYLHTIL